MRYTNLPDDYGSGWLICPKHKLKYHMSDRVCDSCVDEYVEKHSQQFKEGDSLDDRCVCITSIDGDIKVSDTFKEGWMIIDKRPAVGISLMPDKKLLGATYFENREQAINNGYEIILEFNNNNQ